MAAMPDLAEISNALFGGYLDSDALVAKMDPGVSDVHVLGGGSNRAGTPPLVGRSTGRRRRPVRKYDDGRSTGKRTLALIGTTATGVGGALGLRELGEAGQELGHPGMARAVSRGVKIVPAGVRSALKNPKVRIGAVSGMLAGDAIATGEQIHAMRRRPRRQVEVDKALPGVGALKEGFLTGSRFMTNMHAPTILEHQAQFAEHVPRLQRRAQKQGMINANRNPATRKLVQSYGGHQGTNERLNWLRENQTGRRTARAAQEAPASKPKLNSTQRAIQTGQAARADIGRMAQTTSGKVALGAGGTLVGVKALQHHRAKAGAPAEDPYAYYGKSASQDVTFSGTFSKFDDEKRLAFGWANVSKIDGLPIVDRQGDYVSIEDIEEAAYTYVEQSRVGGDMHKRIGGKADGTGDRPHHVADLVESMVFDDDKCDSLGLPDDFPRGWWVGFRVFDDDVWEMAKDGRRTGFSIHGKGIRKSVDYDSLMGY